MQAARHAVAHNASAAPASVRGMAASGEGVPSGEALAALRAWAQNKGLGLLAAICDQAAAESPVGPWIGLPGPTGEANLYGVRPREAVLCLVDEHPGSDADRLAQLAAVLAVGSHAVWPATAQALFERLPAAVREHVSLAQDWSVPTVSFDAALHHGSPASWLATAETLAMRAGPIVGLTGLPAGEGRVPLERLVIERALSINTAAAGGNASLMTIS